MRSVSTLLKNCIGQVIHRTFGAITCVETSRAVVAFTFDDGPHPAATPALLAILKKYGARATFFMIGEEVVRHRSIFEAVAAGGHAIGNHSWAHLSLPLLAGAQRRREIRACKNVLMPYGERLFRPPYGHQTTSSRLDALWQGYDVVTWSVNAIDWHESDPCCIVERVGPRLKPGSIVLFHDGQFEPGARRVSDRSATVEAVERLLSKFHSSVRFVTVPELLRCGRPIRQPWYLTADGELLSRLRVQAKMMGGPHVQAAGGP